MKRVCPTVAHDDEAEIVEGESGPECSECGVRFGSNPEREFNAHTITV